MNEEEQKKNMWMTYGVMLGMLIFGSANTLIQDAQLKTEADGNLFTHPYMQCAFMFVGELSVWIAYGGKKYMRAKKVQESPVVAPMLSPISLSANEKQLKTNCNPLLLAIPAGFDFTASTLMFISLTMTPASVY